MIDLVVHPGSVWLAYDVACPARLARLLPAGLELAAAKLLDEDSATTAPKLLFNAYTVASSPPYMVGRRIDIQTLAKDPVAQTHHLVVLDVLSDTLLWDPVYRVQLPNAVFRSYGRRAPCDRRRYHARRRRTRQALSYDAEAGAAAAVSHAFAVEANRVCYFAEHAMRFPMAFDEAVVGGPVRKLALSRLRNDLWADFRTPDPSHAFEHPHPMTFSVDTPASFA